MVFSKDVLNFGAGLGSEYFTKTNKSRQYVNINWLRGPYSYDDNRILDMKENIVVAGILLKGNIIYHIVSQIAFFADFGIGVYRAKLNYGLEWDGSYEYRNHNWYLDSDGYWKYG